MCNDDNTLNKLVSRSEMEALVFKANILLKEPDNPNREFILKCFLSDQSFSVSEINSQTAGKFCTIYLYYFFVYTIIFILILLCCTVNIKIFVYTNCRRIRL